MNSTKAVFQFRQDKILFGADAAFRVEIEPGDSHQIPGGMIGRVFLDRTGSFRVRASIDNNYSEWLDLQVADGEVIDLMIAPPAGKWNRAFRLLAKNRPFIEIVELARAVAV